MYLSYFLATFLLSLILTFCVAWMMRRFEIVDLPRVLGRKIHKKMIPLGGGLAIFASFFIIVGLAFVEGSRLGQEITSRSMLGLLIGSLILMVGGFLDDKYNLRPRYQFLFPILAALSVIVFGIGIPAVTNPSGGLIDLSTIRIPVDGLGNVVLFADLLVFIWLIGMMYTTKFLDGLDGLVAGITGIGALVIFFLCLQKQWFQPEIALVSIIFAGACLGFLVWNWHPAKIFLGEGGSLFAGFILGTLAIISGGKITATLLIVGVPMLDLIRVVIRRLQNKKPIYIGDSEHLHFRLLESGLSHKQSVLLLYSISFLFGLCALFLQSSEKLIALSFLFILMLLVGVWFSRKK